MSCMHFSVEENRYRMLKTDKQ